MKIFGKLLLMVAMRRVVCDAYCALSSCSQEVSEVLDTTRKYVRKQAAAVVYVNANFYNNTPSYGQETPPIYQTDTAVFYPTIDEYSKLTVVGSGASLTGQVGVLSFESVLVYVDVLTSAGVLRTPAATWMYSSGTNFYVTSRTAIISVDMGVIKGIDWTTTSCFLSLTQCADQGLYYQISAYQAGGDSDNVNQDITVYIGWNGTDANGYVMSSARDDIWRFKNIF